MVMTRTRSRSRSPSRRVAGSRMWEPSTGQVRPAYRSHGRITQYLRSTPSATVDIPSLASTWNWSDSLFQLCHAF